MKINELKSKLDMIISDYEFEYNEEKNLVKIVKFVLLSSVMQKNIAYWISMKDVYINRVYEIIREYDVDCIVCIADFMSEMTLLSSANGMILKDYFPCN